MTDAELVTRAKALLDRLAETPRFAGSADEARARAVCRTELETAGFTCIDQPFEFSEWPARWGPPLATLLQLLALLVVMQLAQRGDALLAVLVAAAAFATLTSVGANVRRYGITSSRYARSSSVNLQASRGNPSVWLAAHLDSKSQTVPMLVRIASSVALQLISVLVIAAVSASVLGVRVGMDAWRALEIAAIAAALPTVLCFVRNDSNGAVDNATGVAAALLAASHAGAPRNLGVLITSGEELGLAGARVWASTAPANIKVLNCDTVDDVGGWRCMYSGARPVVITSAAEIVGGRLGLPIRTGRLIPGILADNIAFTDVRIEAVTVSRGNFSTLARIHTRRDNSIALTGRGAAEAGVLLSALAKELG